MFRLKKGKCLLCDKPVADGFERSLHNIPHRKPKKDPKKKLIEETKQQILQEIQQRAQPASFGIAGIGIQMVEPQ